jgi:hypothetical protein
VLKLVINSVLVYLVQFFSFTRLLYLLVCAIVPLFARVHDRISIPVSARGVTVLLYEYFLVCAAVIMYMYLLVCAFIFQYVYSLVCATVFLYMYSLACANMLVLACVCNCIYAS